MEDKSVLEKVVVNKFKQVKLVPVTDNVQQRLLRATAGKMGMSLKSLKRRLRYEDRLIRVGGPEEDEELFN